MSQPKPLNYRILVQPLPVVKETPSGIERMSDEEWELQSHAMDVGHILRIGPKAFEDDRFEADEVKVGDKIRFRKFAGRLYREKDELGLDQGPFYRVINDEDVLQVFEEDEQ